MNYPNLRAKERKVILESLRILDAYGVSIEQNDLIYGKFQNGYIVAYCNYDLDVFLTSKLPKEQSCNEEEFIIMECLGFRHNKEDKYRLFEQIVEKAGEQIKRW